jgi:hypothetical protein
MAKSEAKTTEVSAPPLNIIEDPPKPTPGVTEDSAKEAKAGSGILPTAVATAPIPEGHEREVLPVLPTQFGLYTHKLKQFSAIAPTGMTKEDIAKPEFWKHVAAQLQQGYEVRILAEDYAWVAYGIVTFKHSNNVKVTVTGFTQIDDVSYDTGAIQDRYVAKQRGVLKWCIVDTETGENVFTNIPTQGKALLELDEYRATLNR